MEEDIWFSCNANLKYSALWQVEPGMEVGGEECGKHRGDKGVLRMASLW